jgi:hypothetical protein
MSTNKSQGFGSNLRQFVREQPFTSVLGELNASCLA